MNKEKTKNILLALWDDIVVLALSFFGGFVLGRCFNLFGEQSIKVFVTAIAIYGAYTLTTPTFEDNSKFVSKSIIYVIVVQLIYAFVCTFIIGNSLADKILTWILRSVVYVFFFLSAIFCIIFWLVNRKKSPSDDDEDVEIIEDIEDTKKRKS